MNKELIKKYFKEFNHWINGGKVQAFYKKDDEPKWLTDEECIEYEGHDNFSHIMQNSLEPEDVLIVIDDEYIHFRIKPEPTKFKVGDWVIHNGKYKRVTKAVDGYIDSLDNQVAVIMKEESLELWEPKPGEWCWVFNKLRGIPVLRRAVRVEDNFKNRYDDVKFTKAVRVGREDYLDEEVGYRFCEPFIGQLPTSI